MKSLYSVKIAWYVFDLGKKPDYTDDELAISLGDANNSIARDTNF